MSAIIKSARCNASCTTPALDKSCPGGKGVEEGVGAAAAGGREGKPSIGAVVVTGSVVGLSLILGLPAGVEGMSGAAAVNGGSPSMGVVTLSGVIAASVVVVGASAGAGVNGGNPSIGAVIRLANASGIPRAVVNRCASAFGAVGVGATSGSGSEVGVGSGVATASGSGVGAAAACLSKALLSIAVLTPVAPAAGVPIPAPTNTPSRTASPTSAALVPRLVSRVAPKCSMPDCTPSVAVCTVAALAASLVMDFLPSPFPAEESGLSRAFVAYLSPSTDTTPVAAASATSLDVACSKVLPSFFRRSLSVLFPAAATAASGTVTAAAISGKLVTMRSVKNRMYLEGSFFSSSSGTSCS